MSDSPALLRARQGHDSAKVAFVELFFDLVFVFAVTQLSHALIGHFSPLGALQTAMLLLAVWWVWIFTTWVTNWLDPEKLPVRLALLVLMTLGLVLSAAIPAAFTSRGIAFARAYVTMQVGRSLFFLWAVRGDPNLTRNFQRILCWFSSSAILWLAGAFAEPTTRMICWGGALVIEYISPSLGFPVPGLGRSASTEWKVSGHHIAERCGLFIIIALGESILVAGATFSELVWNAAVISAFVASLAGSIAMWWLYFDSASDFGTHRIAKSENPGQLARLAYTYLHLIPVAGIILSAVADEFVLAHPSGHSELPTIIAVLGGNMLYLFGSVLFKRAIAGHTSRAHLLAIVLLAALFPLAHALEPWLLMAIGSLVLCVLAWWERRSNCLQIEEAPALH
ncbi:low temperature requirement protein A [Haloferula sp. BvORR071]|uniref:low temperature requirement protein A n=1 Tax=Haloferula sp. BvORR071 TaxID=1396141 RepID=UPI00055796FB|nr:low temperature requirement protein A [Haloferula sp. BvORR071]